jgi:hypothetical protein
LFVRKIILSIISAAALAVCSSGSALAEEDDLPAFCIGKKTDGKGGDTDKGRITCKPPSEGMRWMGFARCRWAYASGGGATGWNRSVEVQGTAFVFTRPCTHDPRAIRQWIDLLSWEEIK